VPTNRSAYARARRPNNARHRFWSAQWQYPPGMLSVLKRELRQICADSVDWAIMLGSDILKHADTLLAGHATVHEVADQFHTIVDNFATISQMLATRCSLLSLGDSSTLLGTRAVLFSKVLSLVPPASYMVSLLTGRCVNAAIVAQLSQSAAQLSAYVGNAAASGCNPASIGGIPNSSTISHSSESASLCAVSMGPSPGHLTIPDTGIAKTLSVEPAFMLAKVRDVKTKFLTTQGRLCSRGGNPGSVPPDLDHDTWTCAARNNVEH
jgi:hypothetical protein